MAERTRTVQGAYKTAGSQGVQEILSLTAEKNMFRVMRIYNLLTNQGHYSRSGETDHIRFLMEFREIHLPEWEIYLFLRFVKLFLRLEGSERKWINLIKRHHPGEMLQERAWKSFCPKLSGRSKSRCFQNLIIATLLQSACIIRK